MPTDIERDYLAQGYELPDGLDWERVAQLRAHWGVSPIFVPLAHGSGCIGWGVPFVDGKPLRHPPASKDLPCAGNGAGAADSPHDRAAAPAPEGR